MHCLAIQFFFVSLHLVLNKSCLPPCFDDGFHIMQTGITSDVGWLQALVNLCSLLQLHDLLGGLQQTHMDM